MAHDKVARRWRMDNPSSGQGRRPSAAGQKGPRGAAPAYEPRLDRRRWDQPVNLGNALAPA
jgi:hypothetical protein